MQPNEVKTQITRLLNEHPELAEDGELLHDMLEGETEVMVVVKRLLELYNEDRMLVAGIKTRKQELTKRAERLEFRMENTKATMRDLLKLLPDGQRVLRLAEGTVSYRKAGEGSTFIYDLDQIPQGFFRTKREPLLTEIGTALKAGQEVPGAQLMPGKDGITIRQA